MTTRSEHPIPDAVLSQHAAFLGMTGSGKTSTAKLLIERVAAEGARVCILDTIKADWWGITSSASGERPGLPFKIIGGQHGHAPLHPNMGKVIGELVGRGTLPLSIIDMEDFDEGEPQKFFVDFARALFKSARGVVYLVIEEAHEIAPKERAGFGHENKAIYWAKKLATAARKKGVRLIVLTQRVQALHNAVLGSCSTIVAHRITLPADKKPIEDWLKANVDKDTREKIAGSLSSLPTGTGWICSGEAQITRLVQFPKISTFDNTATPTGDGHDHEVATAPVDITELRTILGEAVQEADARDPNRIPGLLAEIERLKQQALTVPPEDTGAIETAFEAGKEEGKRVTLHAVHAGATAMFETALRDLRDKAAPLIAAIEATIAKAPQLIKVSTPDIPPPAAVKTPIARKAEHAPMSRQPSLGATPEPPSVRKILDAIHRAHPVALTFEAAAARAAISRRSSAYERYRKAIEASPEVIKREDGRFVPRNPKNVGPGINPIEEFAARLPPSYASMLRVIATHRGMPVRRDRIADLAGVSHTSSGLDRGLKELQSLGLIEKNGEGFALHRDMK